jgi:hypothetical protein
MLQTLFCMHFFTIRRAHFSIYGTRKFKHVTFTFLLCICMWQPQNNEFTTSQYLSSHTANPDQILTVVSRCSSPTELERTVLAYQALDKRGQRFQSPHNSSTHKWVHMDFAPYTQTIVYGVNSPWE